ncbi:hypothetical protein PISMIDRAFT_378018 [Pisolithus microcarpus 441]|uniref:Hydrophobin n=1 Tax=Pisolithus microcarpus 441 TaxID=765257 RepID=A0A0C9ZYP1_9AGAM|nr:hypothetical protein PISMIDRAFT_378018 [Pisolithus microcarpus 441]
MKSTLIFTLAAAALAVSAVPATELTPRTYKRVCCANLGPASDPTIKHLMEEYSIGGAANNDILGFACHKLKKRGKCASDTKEGYCSLDSYVKPHIYKSCEKDGKCVVAMVLRSDNNEPY